jgi:hypothetical protein
MKSSRIGPFILLNILISVAATLLVLFVWERSRSTATEPELTLSVVEQPTVPGTRPTLPPLSKPALRIDNVFGVGDVKTEVVVIRQVGDGRISLAGWRLQSEKGLVFIFPNLELSPGGALQVFSGSGTDTPIELHWRQAAAAWRQGDTVRILDSGGNLRAEYKIP